MAEEPQLPSRANSSRRKSAFSGNFSNTFPSSRPGTTSSAIPVASIIPPNDESYPFHSQQPTYYHSPLDTTLETPTEPESESQLRPRIPRRPSSQAHAHPSRLSARRPSTKQGDALSPEDNRDSISSNGSWIRRLSIRPLSQHESLRSSIGPDSPSVFSHNSGAPILGFTGYTQPQLPPNKLVKRASTRNGGNVDSSSPRGSRSQMTLRRPATSHQRSATLQQQIEAESLPPLPKFSSEHQSRPRAQTLAAPRRSVSGPSPSSTTTWKSFWHSRIARLSTRNTPLRLGDSSALPNAKRICVENRGFQGVYLMTPNSIMPGCAPVEEESSPERPSNVEDSPQSNGSPDSPDSPDSPEATPSKPPRRSISMHFSSPSSWLSKAGSIKRRKRGGGEAAGENKRHVSAPVSADTTPEKASNRPATAVAFNGGEPSRAESDLAAIFRPPNTTRSSSPPLASPLPPLNRLSSFHIDLSQLRSTSPTSLGRPDNLASSTATRRVHSGASQARTLDRSSTVASSEYHRGFTSSGDDDTDFKTDTPWDSLRTTASGRRRTVDSPAESMFDESPPSTAGNNTKRKRLSIQEILGPMYDGGNKIMEEDENLPTPIRGANPGLEARFLVPKSEPDDELKFGSLSPEFTLSRDPRISLDDDDEFDWAREDESQIFHHLSPPSSMNSRRGSPSLRIALANISGNNAFDPHHDTAIERPRSTIFDWTETTHHDKHDGDGYSFRPKTVHGKQEIDLRGGRPNRKGPTHVRSQSVPALPDPVESSKSTPKFGTWGLSSKNVSEDWDDDFEFEEETDFALVTGKKHDKRFSMVVPPSIQATQPTVKAHSGQIRELSLLVNDLKRLCRLGREMDMLRGSSSILWREAGDIIALASPDEDSSTDETTPELKSSDDDPVLVDPRFSAQGFDGTSLDDFEHDSRASPNHKASGNPDRRSSRRRSVFSPEDDIFGTWDQVEVTAVPDRPVTPDKLDINNKIRSTGDARSVMAAMRSQTPKPAPSLGYEPSNTKLNFDTNSLKELVKQASELRDALSDLVRKADCITQSPARTPRRDRNDGSPAFTRVFDGPTPSPSRRLPQSHSSSSVLSSASVAGSPSNGNGLNQRMQMMTVK